MEIIFEFIFSIFGEILLQLLAEICVELGLHGVAETIRRKNERNAYLAFIGYGILGGVVGAISLFIFPDLLLDNRLHAVGNLIVTPIIAGLVLAYIGRVKTRRGKSTIRLDSFLFGFIFAFTMALTRYSFG